MGRKHVLACSWEPSQGIWATDTPPSRQFEKLLPVLLAATSLFLNGPAAHAAGPDAQGGEAVLIKASSAWSIDGNHVDAQLGTSVAAAGDVNADGYDDVVVGSPREYLHGNPVGAAFLYLGSASGPVVAPGWPVYGPGEQSFGASIAGVGDVDGDGFDDLLVGSHSYSNGQTSEGRVLLYRGSPSGPSTAPFWTWEGNEAGIVAGFSLSAAGDVNGDGYDDFIVSAPMFGMNTSQVGRAFLFLGSPTGPGAAPSWIADGEINGSRFGWAVAGAGDVNGDGYDDILVGAPESHGSSSGGRAYLFLGSPGGLSSVPSWSLFETQPQALLGFAVSGAGDIDGDGFDDVMISAPNFDGTAPDAGKVLIFRGGPSGLSADPYAALEGPRAGDVFGYSIASAGDLNRDGLQDILVGAIGGENGQDAEGVVYAYLGSASGPFIQWTMESDELYAELGHDVSSAGRVTQSGRPGILVGCPRCGNGLQNDAGRAYLYLIDEAPLLLAPTSVEGREGLPLRIDVTAFDIDGDPISSLMATPIPDGATFAAALDNSSGVLAWTPGYSQQGSYMVIFTASNGQAGSAETKILVRNTDRHPVIDPVSNHTVAEGTVLDVPTHASDPDGDIISLSLNSAPPFASFIPAPSQPGDALGTMRFAPGFTHAGTYPHITITARAGLDDTDSNNVFVPSVSTSFDLTVMNTNRPPLVSGPAGVFGGEGTLITFAVSGADPDGDNVTLSVLNRPPGALFIDDGDGTGSFSWTPGHDQAGSHMITFIGRDPHGGIGTRSVDIVIDDVNRAPIASAGGPYSGIVNTPLIFNGTDSSDPDGSMLQYTWDFGDLSSGFGAAPSHSYSAGGTFTVTLTVSDGVLTHTASTLASIQDIFPARAFVTKPNRTIRLGSGKATWCCQVEPVDGSYLNTAVDLPRAVLRYGGGQIPALSDKPSLYSDQDGNGIQELGVCFGKSDLRNLFSDLPRGTNTVNVTLEGDLTTGGKFRTTATIEVVSSGGNFVAHLSPNPLNPTGTLTFLTSRSGRIRVSVYDSAGHLVRVLLDQGSAPAGYHDVPVDGLGLNGTRLASGVYFYLIEAEEGSSSGKLIIAK